MHHAKAVSAGSTEGSGNSRGLFRRAFATRGASSDAEGSGARSNGRLRATLAVLALAIAAFAITAVPASAATQMGTISNVSYGSAHLTGTVKANELNTPWSFEYCTQECSEPTATWKPGPGGTISFAVGQDRPVEANIEKLKGGTQHFIRLTGGGVTSPAAPPYPSFTPLTADPPSVEQTDNASEVEYTTAKLTGKVNRPNKSNALTCNFEYITDAAYLANPVGERFTGATPVPCAQSPVATEGSSTVSAKLTGLTNATVYHLRLVVSNAVGEDVKEAPSTFTTLTVDPPTIVATDNASAVFSTSASASGKVKRLASADPAFDVSACNFEFVTDAQFTATGFAAATAVPCDQATPFTTPNGETNVTAHLEGLSPATTYHLRLAAKDAASAAATKEATATFTTAAKVAKPTVVATDEATNADKRSAQATGKVERPAGADPALDVSCRFEFVTDAQFTATGFENAGQAPCVGRNEVQSLTLAATAGQFRLTYGGQTTADIRFNAEAFEVQDALQSIGAEVSVSGGPGNGAGSTPYRITFVGGLAEKDVEQIGAETGAVPLAGTANVTTLTTGTTAFKALNDPPASQPKDIGAELSGLTPSTTYHLRLAAENGGGTDTKEAANTFTTLAVVHPTATVDPLITEVGYTRAHATATVNPGNQNGLGGWQITVAGKDEWIGPGEFEMSPARTLSTTIPCFNPFVACNGHLKPGTTYQLRIAGNDYEEGTFFSSGPPYAEFTTKGTSTPPSATFGPVTAVTGTTAHFSGSVDTHAPAEALSEDGKFAYKTEWEFVCTPECPPSPDLSGTVQGEEGSKAISANVIRLQPHTYYEVKLIAHNILETVETPIQPFETPLVKPSIEPAPGGSDGEGGYFLEGIVNSNNSKITECHFEYGTTSTYPNTYNAPCLPSPSGPDEVQQVNIDATEGQFKLSFRGQTTADIAFNATPAQVQAALRALPKIGSTGVNVSGTPQAYKVTFASTLAGTNVEPLKSSDGTTPLGGGGGVSVSTTTEGGTNHSVSIEAHLENLTIGSTYHFRIFATNAAGTESSSDHTFIPTLAVKGPECPNEQLRSENLSLGLPECRAYEMVSYPNKEGNSATLQDFNEGDAVVYGSPATNIAGSGQGFFLGSVYAATRTAAGWETIPNLNGPTGSMSSSPEHIVTSGPPVYSADLLSSVWVASQAGAAESFYFRGPDGRFLPLGKGALFIGEYLVGASDDLSHVVFNSRQDAGGGQIPPQFEGPAAPGIAEFVGIGNGNPRRVDLNNLGDAVSECTNGNRLVAKGDAVSRDGNVIVFTANGTDPTCAAASHDNGVSGALWARVDGTTSYDLSASLCNRADCDAPAAADFQGMAKDGSRVFFTTTQQLLNGDTDQTNDLYACDIPTGVSAPVGMANPCAPLTEVSGASSGAKVLAGSPSNFGAASEDVTVSDDGSTAYFTAEGVIAGNEDALGETAVPGDDNLYVWRTDAAHPAGQTTFVARLPEGDSPVAQTTPDGRYLLLQTSGRLVSTDTDNSTDVYRYDADTGEMVRVSTGVSGAGGNGEFDATLSRNFISPAVTRPIALNTMSDNGQLIVFSTKEALSPLDGNGEPDAYLWNAGHALGSVAPVLPTGPKGEELPGQVSIDGSGQDIYVQTGARLTPTDIDAGMDVYDVRIGGGFPQHQEGCAGEACQPGATPAPPRKAPTSEQPGSGNPTSPKPCPKGKVKKHGKCVKKSKKHHKKAHKAKQAGKNRGGAK